MSLSRRIDKLEIKAGEYLAARQAEYERKIERAAMLIPMVLEAGGPVADRIRELLEIARQRQKEAQKGQK